MNRLRRDKLVSSTTSSTRNSMRSSWPRGASALLATAMLLLAMAPFQNAANADSLREVSRQQWATISSSLVCALGATDEITARAQGEQLFRWMQSRVAGAPTQNLSAGQVARWLHQWQTQVAPKSGVQTPRIRATNGISSTRCSLLLVSQLPKFSFSQRENVGFSTRRFARFLPHHAAAKLSGVRTNRRHE